MADSFPRGVPPPREEEFRGGAPGWGGGGVGVGGARGAPRGAARGGPGEGGRISSPVVFRPVQAPATTTTMPACGCWLLAEQDVPASVANDFADIEKWLPVSRLLITYVAGPYPDAAQCRAIQPGSRRAATGWACMAPAAAARERVEGVRQRRTVKTEHHALLGSFFLTHPRFASFASMCVTPITLLTRGLGASFDVEDEPYFIELQDPGSTRILLTADYGPTPYHPASGLYGSDTSLQPDGRTRVLGYTREVGKGGVTYFALGHCHNPASRAGRTDDPTDTQPPTFRGSWETDAFIALLRNAIAWGVGEP